MPVGTPPSTTIPDLLEALIAGGYPRLHDKAIPPADWLANYVRTYVERDVAEVLRVETSRPSAGSSACAPGATRGC